MYVATVSTSITLFSPPSLPPFLPPSLPSAPPEVVLAPPNSSVSSGDTVLFSCVALGYPPPSISWVKGNGTFLSNSSRITIENTTIVQDGVIFIHSILEICSVEVEDEDYYTCFANNSAGYDKSSFLLTVFDEGREIYQVK